MCFRVEALLCAAILIISGCSVKENRSRCPCSLFLTFANTGFDGPVDLAWTMFGTNEGNVTEYDELPGTVSLSVGRVMSDLRVIVAGAGVLDKSGDFVIPPGEDCSPCFIGREYLDCRGEFAETVMTLHKNYAMLSCVLVNGNALGRGLEYYVKGSVCGYGTDGAIISGTFSCPLKYRKSSAGTILAEVGIPRQTDTSLKLEVSSPEGKLLRTFALGEYIAASGYDWNADDLEDIVIQINIAATDLSVVVLTGSGEIHLSYTL